jgi:hypothetical protein
MKRVRAARFSSLTSSANLCSFAVVSLSPLDSAAGKRTCFAHVPFDFSVGEITLRAGTYTVAPSDQVGVVTMRAAADPSPLLMVQIILVPSEEDAAPGRILFYCRRERYYLAQVLADRA